MLQLRIQAILLSKIFSNDTVKNFPSQSSSMIKQIKTRTKLLCFAQN
jgi:hypothetical protein